MQSLNYWTKFASTGRIEDYLSYVYNDKSPVRETAEQAGENPYAGIYMCDRNHIETGAYRGI